MCLLWFPGGHFLRGLITKSLVLSIFDSSDNRFFFLFEIHIGLHTRSRFMK